MTNLENRLSANLESRIDLSTMKIKETGFTDQQKQFFHLIDPRFFPENANPYQMAGKVYNYETDLNLQASEFHLHPFLDPKYLEVGSERRFNEEVNRMYIAEKYEKDKWVSEGNNQLALYLEKWVQENLEQLRKQEKIKLLDVGPCCGAITTLFALRALDRANLLDKTEVYLLDIVPEVINMTKKGDFIIPNEMVEEYDFQFAGKDGEKYRELMQSDRVHGMIGDGEVLPDEVQDIDINLAAYVHHHMNLIARKGLSEQMEEASRSGGFVGVVDFFVNSYEEYMNWYKPHFEEHQVFPPVEYPLVSAETLSGFYQSKIRDLVYQENSFVFWGQNENENGKAKISVSEKS